MDLLVASIAVGLLVVLTRRRLALMAAPRHVKFVRAATAFAATTCLAIALLSLPAALAPARPDMDLGKIATSLSPASPTPLGGGLILESVTAEGPSRLVYRCSTDPALARPLQDIQTDLKSSLEGSSHARRLTDMGISLVYRVHGTTGEVLAETVLSPD